jgi:hypothetical protein
MVNDPEMYAEYVERVPVVVERYGGRYLAQIALGRLTGLQVMPEIINLLGLAKLIGD